MSKTIMFSQVPVGDYFLPMAIAHDLRCPRVKIGQWSYVVLGVVGADIYNRPNDDFEVTLAHIDSSLPLKGIRV